MPLRPHSTSISYVIRYQSGSNVFDRLTETTPFAEVDNPRMPAFLKGGLVWHGESGDEAQPETADASGRNEPASGIVATGVASTTIGTAQPRRNLIPFPVMPRLEMAASASDPSDKAPGAEGNQRKSSSGRLPEEELPSMPTNSSLIHRLSGWVPASHPDGTTSLRVDIIAQITSWLASVWPAPLSADVFEQGGHREEAGARVAVVGSREDDIWGMRAEYADLYLPERLWRIDVVLTATDASQYLSFQACAADSVDDLPPPETELPGFIRALMLKPGILDGTEPIRERPVPIRNGDDLARLNQLILSDARRLPVVVLTPEGEGGPSRYPVNPTAAAYACAGLAHVAAVPPALVGEWRSAANGEGVPAVAVYGGRGEDGRPERLACEPAQIHDQAGKGHANSAPLPIALRRCLLDLPVNADVPTVDFERAALLDRIGIPHVLRLPDDVVRQLIANQQRADALEVRCATLDEQLAAANGALANQKGEDDRLREQVRALNDEVSQLQASVHEQAATVDELRQTLSGRDEEMERLSRRNEGLQGRLEAALDKVREVTEERDALSQQLHWRELMDESEDMPPDEDGASAPEAGDWPATLNELESWVDANLKGKVVLHARALRAAKDALYQNVPLVYQALQLLGNEYRNMRLREGEGDLKAAFDVRLRQLGLSLRRSLSLELSGQYADDYVVAYPSKKHGDTRFLEWHLRKGTSRDPRYTLCIYFFWCEETKQVVVGSLPAHLVNRLT